MTLTRITSILGALALGGVLWPRRTARRPRAAPVAPDGSGHGQHARVAETTAFQPPMPHKYGSNGMRMGLHCETKDMS